MEAGMTHTERTPGKESGQDTADADMGHTKDNKQTPSVRVEYQHDKRELTLYHSDFSEDILENPALYMGPANF